MVSLALMNAVKPIPAGLSFYPSCTHGAFCNCRLCRIDVQLDCQERCKCNEALFYATNNHSSLLSGNSLE